MIVREVYQEDKENFNQLVNHPLQSWEWGEFREKTGVKVIRLGSYEKNRLSNCYQLTIHSLPIPKLDLKIIYLPKGPMPDEPMLAALKDFGQKEKAVYARLEPNVGMNYKGEKKEKFKEIRDFLLANNCRIGRPLFTPFTFRLDLTKSEDELLLGMKEKTRYNLHLAQKNNITVIEDNSPQAFEIYLALLAETTKRQGFYAHTLDYHRKMWSTLQPAGIAHLLLAQYQEKTLVAWVVFVFKNTLYYPYGASSRELRELMPAYAMMWEAIKFGQKNHCTSFDLWGSLGPNPNPRDPWFGWNRFKAGFGPDLIEFAGTYDLVINQQLYPLVRLAENLRWKFLSLKSKLVSSL